MQVETEYVGKLIMPRLGTGECRIAIIVSDAYNPNVVARAIPVIVEKLFFSFTYLFKGGC